MATLLETASLVMVPSGYEDGTLGSLVPTDASGDFTFTRGSNLSATSVNEQGLIEKGYENLLLQSNNFDASPWTLVSATMTPNQSGYDGSNDAWLLSRTGTFGQIIQNITNSGVQTFSIYAKAGTLNWIRLTQGSPNAYFDLSGNGAVGTASSNIDAAIELVGDGWFRCSITSDGDLASVRVYVVNGDNDLSGSSGSIYIQDAQINQGLVAYPYIETTAAPEKGGILADLPRIDHLSGKPSLLLEPQRTNLVRYSEYLATGWQANQCTITATSENNPSGLPFSYNAAAPINTNDRIRYRFGTTTGKHYFSVFIKGDGTTNTIRLRGLGTTEGADAYWNIYSDGSVIFDTNRSALNLNPITENFGNNWYRVGFGVEYNGINASYIDIIPSNGNLTSSVYLWGLQMEQDATYPTSYIPTYGTSQTRLADDMDLNLPAAWDSTGSWTMFFELERMNDDYVNALDIMRFDGTGDLYIKDRRTSVNLVVLGSAGASTANTGIINKGDIYKIAVKWDGTTTKAFFNGGEVLFSDPSSGAYGFNRIPVNRWHKKHKEIYFPTALSDEACIELTTL